MTLSSPVLFIAAADNPTTSLISIFIIVFVVVAIYTCGFILIRNIVLWYWKIDIMVNNQTQHTALLVKQNHLLEHQIKLLTELKDQMDNNPAHTDIGLKKIEKISRILDWFSKPAPARNKKAPVIRELFVFLPVFCYY